MKFKNKLLALACLSAAVAAHGALAADSHTINVSAVVAGNCKFNSNSSSVNLTLDPTAASTVSQAASINYRCTKGTAPAFAFSSGSTSSSTAGNLVNGSDSIPYTYSATPGGAGTGLGSGQDKTLTVTVSVNQANAANVSPATYTDTIAITLTP